MSFLRYLFEIKLTIFWYHSTSPRLSLNRRMWRASTSRTWQRLTLWAKWSRSWATSGPTWPTKRSSPVKIKFFWHARQLSDLDWRRIDLISRRPDTRHQADGRPFRWEPESTWADTGENQPSDDVQRLKLFNLRTSCRTWRRSWRRSTTTSAQPTTSLPRGWCLSTPRVRYSCCHGWEYSLLGHQPPEMDIHVFCDTHLISEHSYFTTLGLAFNDQIFQGLKVGNLGRLQKMSLTARPRWRAFGQRWKPPNTSK